MKKFIILAIITFNIYKVTSQDYTLPNLGIIKIAIREYISSGQYQSDQKKAIDDALLILDNLKMPGLPAVVFDIDETALSTLNYSLQYDLGFESESWNNWILTASAPANNEVKRLYDTLINRNIKVIFLTGRNDKQYEATIQNLKNVGYNQFDTLICKTPEFKGMKAIDYKTEIRRRLSQHYNIIASVGDQWSDLDGGYTIMKVKLPNIFYYLK